nr:MAG TPA: hypothetical protein [Caudoviricetes sp.]
MKLHISLGGRFGRYRPRPGNGESGMYASRRQARGSSYAGAVIMPPTRKMSVRGLG